MSKTSIEWSEMTWNPVTGCSKISAGCKFCYAEILSNRLKAMGLKKYKDGFMVRIHKTELQRPYTWTKPQVVFVNSMSDLFHPEVPESFIRDVFKVMNETPAHTYQVLTKRPERALELAKKLAWSKNIWLGVSVEDARVSHRIKTLKKIPAKIRFLSLEPLIGPLPHLSLVKMHWVIVGGESGPGARTINSYWAKEILIRCRLKGIPFFFKQWGANRNNPNPEDPTIKADHPQHAKGGCQLNGKIYREMPAC